MAKIAGNVTELEKAAGRKIGENRQPTEWREKLQRHGGSLVSDERNVLIAFRTAPELVKLVRFNEFALNVECNRPSPWRNCVSGSAWSETDDAGLLVWLQSQDIAVRSAGVVANAALLAAKDCAFHPVRDYLDAIIWDGKERLRTLVEVYFGAAGNADYNTASVCGS